MEELKKECARVYRSAVRAGVLIKGPCSVCGTTAKIEGHHEDHKKPLEVIWLCKSHHGKLGSEQARVSPNRWKQLEGCRKAGLKNIQTGHIFTLATPENCSLGGKTVSEKKLAHLRKLAKAATGKKRNFTPEWIQKMADGRRGTKRSAEVREKMSIAQKMRWQIRKAK